MPLSPLSTGEARLLGRTLADFGLTSKPVNTRRQTPSGQSIQSAQGGNRFIQAAQQGRDTLARQAGDKQTNISSFRAGDITEAQYNSRLGSLSSQASTAKRLIGQYGQPVSNAQRALSSDRAKEAAINDRFGALKQAHYNDPNRTGGVDNAYLTNLEESRGREISGLQANRAREDSLNADQAERLGQAKQGGNPARSTQGGGTSTSRVRQPFGNRTSAAGIAANKSGVAPTRSQRLGLTPPSSGGMQGGTSGGTAGQSGGTAGSQMSPVPIPTTPSEVPTEIYGTQTNRMGEAASALDSDTIEAPTSLKQIREEEMAALSPSMAALSQIRDSFKIYQTGAESALKGRADQIETYKTESNERSEQVADMKISQSKSNRNLNLELINDARERSRRDELLAQEKNERDYTREEDRIIGENTAKIESMNTALGARYGGFGSGKGLEKIETARVEASRVVRELNEDKIYSRKADQNKLTDIEDKWSDDRAKAFQEHDKNVTAAYTKMVEEAQNIDDKVLTEEGDQTESAINLLKESFTQLDKIWSKAGDDLTKANQRALDRRDDVRKESYSNSQDAFKNMFAALSQMPSNSPLFGNLERAAGLTPGTIGATKSNEERRIAISQGQLSIQQRQMSLDIQKFEQEGNKIDHNASGDLGYLVSSTGKVFRDSFGNPVYLGGAGGSVSSSVGNDSKLFGQEAVGMNTTTSFSNFALSIGDLVPGSPYHKGGEYDIDGLAGTPIPAWTSGTVQKVNKDPNDPYGMYVDISDGQKVVRYAHLQSVNVQQGQQISGVANGQRQLVGLMGNTGNTMGMDGQAPVKGDSETGSHLHIEVRQGDSFETGQRIDAMNASMSPGSMVSGKITWVDDMRKKMQSGHSGSTLNVPWQEIDQSIIDLSKDTFRDPKGATDWKAIGMIYDYVLDNKMGNYDVNYDGRGSIEGTRQASKEAAFNEQTHGRNTTSDRSLLTSGFSTPKTFFNGLTDGTLAKMQQGEAVQYMRDMGYIVQPRFFGDKIREMDASELQVLNQNRQSMGLSPLR